MKNNKDRDLSKAKVYLIGSGIASLASALYLEKDAGVLGKNIYILEKDNIPGGALDGAGEREKGFEMYEAFHVTPHFCKTTPFLKSEH
jgi:oleate hydratase